MTRPDQSERKARRKKVPLIVAAWIFGAALSSVLPLRKRRAASDFRSGAKSLNDLVADIQTARRKPPEAGAPVPAGPPQGPLPKQGGAAARPDLES
jgi:hypothetical protein